ATDVNTAGFDNQTGWGRLNAAEAVGVPYSVTWGANTLPSAMTAGATTSATASFTNSGTLAWSNSGATPVRFAYHWKRGAWPGTSPAVQDGARSGISSSVAPGATVSGLSVVVVAPPSAGTYCLVYDLVHEGVTWFSWQGAAVQTSTVTVSAPAYAVTWG